MRTAQELKQSIQDKADEDQAFRGRLVAEPKKAIEEEFGLCVPEGLDVVVHEDSLTQAHLVLPPNPKLTEEQVAAMAGGSHPY